MGKLIIIPNADFSNNAIGKVTPITNKKRVTLVSNPAGAGILTGDGFYEEGTTVQISATAKTMYSFINWNDGNTSASRSIVTGSDDVSYTANFEFIPEDRHREDVSMVLSGANIWKRVGAAYFIDVKAGDIVEVKGNDTYGAAVAFVSQKNFVLDESPTFNNDTSGRIKVKLSETSIFNLTENGYMYIQLTYVDAAGVQDYKPEHVKINGYTLNDEGKLVP